VAAERKLHTSQPSLSRQIRDLENEVGAQLLMRTARGIELTSAGRAFLDHARSVLSQVEDHRAMLLETAAVAVQSESPLMPGCHRLPFSAGCREPFLARLRTQNQGRFQLVFRLKPIV
jgi:DNA-binding transcriptional LysR family regulator